MVRKADTKREVIRLTQKRCRLALHQLVGARAQLFHQSVVPDYSDNKLREQVRIECRMVTFELLQ